MEAGSQNLGQAKVRPSIPNGGGKHREAPGTGLELFAGMRTNDVLRQSRPHLLIASMTFQDQRFKQSPCSFVMQPAQNSNSWNPCRGITSFSCWKCTAPFNLTSCPKISAMLRGLLTGRLFALRIEGSARKPHAVISCSNAGNCRNDTKLFRLKQAPHWLMV